MPFALSLSRPDWRLSEGARRRAVGLVAVALIHLALTALLLSLAPPTVRKKVVDMVMFSVDTPSEKPKAEEQPQAEETPAETQTITPPQPQAQPKLPEPAEVLDRAELVIPLTPVAPVPQAAPDPPKAPSPPRPSFGPPAPARRSSDSGADTPLVEGTGPNGEPLYAAAWYREPYDDELSGYLSTATSRTGYGTIACRTVAKYRVEDCVIVDEFPPRSGYGRAVQAAAWQFQVRPPQKGGKPMVGEWVQIRIYHGMEKTDRRGR